MIRRVSARVVSKLAASCTPPFRIWPFGRSTNSGSKPPQRFDLDQSVVRLSHAGDELTARSMMAGGVLVIADAGAGKSSSILATLCAGAHRLKMSVVVTTVKPADAEYAWNLARHCGRDDIRVFDLTKDVFNPVAAEQFAAGIAGNHTENLVSLLCLPLRRQSLEGSAADPYWRANAEGYVRHASTIFRLARTPISFALVADSLLNLPNDPEEVGDERWQRRCPLFWAAREAESIVSTPADRDDLRKAVEWLMNTVPSTPDRTRSSIVSTYVASVESLTHGVVSQCLNGVSNTWSPASVIDQPGVLILNCPVQEWGVPGAIVQRMILTAIQRAVLRRDMAKASHPVVLLCDEYQEYLDPVDDPVFMRTARDRNGCMIVATQCVGNIRQACGNAANAQAAAETTLGLPSTKIIGATQDPTTLEYCSRVFSKTLQARITFGSTNDAKKKEGFGFSSPTQNSSIAREYQDDVPAIEIATLARGNGRFAEAIVAQSGRIWNASGRPSLKVAFPAWHFDPR